MLKSGTISPGFESPIPMTVMFSEPVKDFVIGDVTVRGGTPSNFRAVSEEEYEFVVTPASTSVTVTVDIDGGVVTDMAGLFNLPATTLTVVHGRVLLNSLPFVYIDF